MAFSTQARHRERHFGISFSVRSFVPGAHREGHRRLDRELRPEHYEVHSAR